MKVKAVLIYFTALLSLGMLTLTIGCEDTVSFSLNPKCVEVIEGCEYFVYMTNNGSPMYTHKGNCKNSIHIYNK